MSFGEVSKALLNSQYITSTTFYPLGSSYPVTGMTQFILDKSTWSIFITLLSSTGLLMDRSFFLWAIRVKLTGLSFSQTSFFPPYGSFPKYSLAILIRCYWTKCICLICIFCSLFSSLVSPCHTSPC